MQKVGGIIAMIAGLIGLYFAIDIIIAVKIASVWVAAPLPLGGYGGLLFSLLTIVFGGVALGVVILKFGDFTLNSEGMIPSYLIIGSAVLGGILSRDGVLMCMVFALVGGIIGVIAARRAQSAGQAQE